MPLCAACKDDAEVQSVGPSSGLVVRLVEAVLFRLVHRRENTVSGLNVDETCDRCGVRGECR